MSADATDPVDLYNAIVVERPDAHIEDNRCFVRLRTTRWGDSKRGLYETKQVTWLKRASSGYQCLRESVADIGAAETVEKITNLNECEDGVFEAITCNHTHDWESGCLDDWDYQLVPVEFHGPPLRLWLLHGNHL